MKLNSILKPQSLFFKNKEENRFRIFALVISLLTFPNYLLTFSADIDTALPWVFNYVAQGHYDLAASFQFPHGALAFLMYPLAISNNLFVAGFIYVFVSFQFCLNTLRISANLKLHSLMLTSVLLFLLLSFLDIKLLLVALIISNLLLSKLLEAPRYVYLAVFYSVLNLYIKSYGGLISLALIVSHGLYEGIFKRNYKLLLVIISLWLMFIFIFRLALFQSTQGFFNYLIGQYQLSFQNSEAVSYREHNNWWYLIVYLIAYFSIPLFLKFSLSRYYYSIMLIPTFAAWKHAMGRSDFEHLSNFLIFQTVLAFFLIILTNGQERKSILFWALSFVMLGLNTLNGSQPKLNAIPISNFIRPFNFMNTYFNYSVKKQEAAEKMWYWRDGHILPDTMKHIIKNSTVDVFPWNYALIPFNNLNWSPRPGLHSYAIYTPWLDLQNVKHFESNKAAEFIIWEIGLKNPEFKSIDNRNLLNDCPQTMITILQNYDLVYQNSSYLLLKIRKMSVNISKRDFPLLKSQFFKFIKVPQVGLNKLLRAKITIRKNLQGLIKSSLYMGQTYTLVYKTDNNTFYSNKIIAANAKDGLWINPAMLNTQTTIHQKNILELELMCDDLNLVQPDFDIQFEEISFNTDLNFIERCFGIRSQTKLQ